MRGTRAIAVGATLALAVAGCGASSAPEDDTRGSAPVTTTAGPGTPTAPSAPATPTSPTEPTPGNPDAGPAPEQRIPVREAVGQMIVTRYHGATPTKSVLTAIRSGRAGGVILFADNVPSSAVARKAVRRLVRAAEDGGRPRPLVLIDQEGGDVKRLRRLPPDVSAATIGASPSPEARARREGQKTGRALRRLGIDVDLAPVADVPRAPDSFLGTRAFSRSAEVVARAACGFAAGLQDEGVSAALKHFPGLGRAGGNTDFERIEIGASERAIRTDLGAYARCGADVDFVMLSSAAYPGLGIRRPAVLASRTYRLLAEQGFDGLTISDAFDTPAIVGQDRPAFQAVRAGLDVLLFTAGERPAQVAFSRLVADVRAGRLRRERVEDAARRIIDHKLRTAGR
ncbi:MAG: hypothetical protein ITG02_01715 [Patulibacter sp.]|nr:hypothetical protein [Patulibacter sp.]